MTQAPFVKIPHSLIDSDSFTEHEKIVLVVLLRFADAKGQCWPSLRTIADRAAISKPTVQRTLALLIEKGIVRKTNRTEDGTAEPTSNLYSVDGGMIRVTIPMVRQTIGMVTETTRYSHSDHLTRSKEIDHKNAQIDGHHFTQLWSIYPRKVGKREAEKAYSKLIKSGVDHTTMLRAVSAYAHEIQTKGTEDRFVKHCSSFLNSGRWEDYDGPVAGNADRFESLREQARQETGA